MIIIDFKSIGQKEILAEIRRENAMRRKVYGRRIDDQFSPEHRQYLRTVAIEQVLEAMTPIELWRITERIKAQEKADEKEQLQLF